MSRQEMLRKLSSVSFAMFDLHLYLDTHPRDSKAMSLYNRYEQRMIQIKSDFEKLYGPLTFSSAENAADWLKSPWPWDVQGGNQ